MQDNKILDGKTLAQNIKKQLQEEIKKLSFTPNLKVILVGNDPASSVYVRNKEKSAEEIGINAEVIQLQENTTTEELLKIIHKLNEDKEIDGILVQLPLPPHIDKSKVLESIDPEKDVDGFHPYNMGKLAIGEENVIPCTPKGIIRLLEEYRIDVSGKDVVVVGRSNIVGRPLAFLLINRNATVTVCHSKTKELKEKTKQADILIVAIGKPEYITSEFVKEGAVVIDVGINRIPTNDEKGYKLVGDVNFEDVVDKVSFITPVPGGVGPLTVAMALENTLFLAKKRRKLL